ncbi:MAG: hypothetical protein HY788_01355 [Deltaproteobacteria bacterium]|nr:hypothetical protein [Deltaproteobacteria bacterium]
MDTLEKARIRISHWISHNEHHIEEYELFAEQLEEAGKAAAAAQIRELARLEKASTECLRKALLDLEER